MVNAEGPQQTAAKKRHRLLEPSVGEPVQHAGCEIGAYDAAGDGKQEWPGPGQVCHDKPADVDYN